jgi:hypothetical protein
MLLLHTPTGQIHRSYPVDHELLPILNPNQSHLYADAFARSPDGLPCKDYIPGIFYPLIMLAKMETQMLFPGHQIATVEVNPLLRPQSESIPSAFELWFEVTRGEEISRAVISNRDRLLSSSKVFKRAERRDLEKIIERAVASFRRSLRQAVYVNLGYNPADLENVEYHYLTFDPRQLLKSRSMSNLSSMAQELLNSRSLWELTRSCAKAFNTTPSLVHKLTAPQRPLRLLAFG